MFAKTKKFSSVIAVTLLMTKAVSCITCPSGCQCTAYNAKCSGKHLRTIPKDIPLTARRIDISNNPQIKIPSDYFLQFKHLFILSLRNCSQRGPIFLPNTIKDVRLDDNVFTIDALREMLSTKLKSLVSFSLASNHLQTSDTKALLKILPARLMLLNLNYNKLRTLTREEMLPFKDIQILRLESSSIGNIESNTFDHMRKLSKLRLNRNKLSSLPDNLFKYNSKLSMLELRGNKLIEFNATRLGLRNLKLLQASNNGISTFDIQSMHLAQSVILNNNKIPRLESNIFHNPIRQGIVLSFSNNNISFISGSALQGVKRVSELLLNNNSIKSLPKGMFKGIMIKRISLHNNQISHLNGAFHGIGNLPVTLILTGNNGFISLNGSELQGLTYESKLYLNCQKLRNLTNLYALNAIISCIPNADEIVYTKYYDGFASHGYQCKKVQFPRGYNCRACRRGYYSWRRDSGDNYGFCVKCPAGSYYQDQSASTSCKLCRPGQFVSPENRPGKDATDCRTCPEGTNTTSVAGTRACNCLPGYSRRYRFGPCKKCFNKGYDCSNDYQVLNNEFWMTWKGTESDYGTSTKHANAAQRSCEHAYKAYIRNLDITDDTYDRETMYLNCEMPLPIKCPMPKSCVGGKQPKCSKGYNGVLCAVCSKGYTHQFEQCVKCPKSIWTAMQLIGSLTQFLIFCYFITLTDKLTVTESLRNEQNPDSRTFADVMLSSLKLLIGFYQLLISIIHALSHVNWPENVMAAINILQYIQFQILHLQSIRCINSGWKINAIDELWIILIIIASISFLTVEYYFIKSSYIHYFYSSPSEAMNTLGRNCIRFVALLLFTTHILISLKIIEILPISCHSFCTANRNGTCVYSMSFLRSDYSIPCPTMADQKAVFLTGYSLLIIPLSMPIILCMLLWFYTQRQNTHVYFLHQLPLMKSALEFTYENYHSRYWYWEVIETIRKLFMTAGIVLFVGHSKIGLTCTIIVAMFFTILHAIVKPFKSKFESGAQFLSLILIPLNLAFGAVLQSQDSHHPTFINNGVDYVSLGNFIVAMNSSLIIVILARIIFLIVKTIMTKMQQ